MSLKTTMLNGAKAIVRSLEDASDATVALFDPMAGGRRIGTRAYLREFGYDAARPGNLRGSSGGMAKNASSESWRAQKDRIDLMWEARDMERNNPIMQGLVHRVCMYVTAHLSYEANTGDEIVDKIYNDYFHDWCQRCDITGRRTFRKLIELAFKGMLVDGDAGLILKPTGPELLLQLIEADRIGNPLNNEQGEHFFGGLNLDPATGAVLNYKIFERTRTNQYVNPQDVLPAQFIHLADFARGDQYRPVSYLQIALPHARDMHEMLLMEKAAMKWASTYAGFFISKNPNARNSALKWDGEALPDGTKTMEAQIGKLLQLAEGEDVKFAPGSQRPSGAFLAAVQTFMRHMSIGLDLPYGFCYDLGLLGGVSQRIELMLAQRRIQYWQQHILVDKALNRIKDEVLQWGIARREIPVAMKRRADGQLVPSWREGRFNFGPWLTGDVGHQTTADLALVANGLKSRTRFCGEYFGTGYAEVAEEGAKDIQIAQRVAGETNVPLELQAPMGYPNASQLLAAMATPPEPPPAPGSQAAIGDKGVQNITDILIAVTKGELDRDAAVLQLVNTYGMPMADAEAIVPEPSRAQRDSAAGEGGPRNPPEEEAE